MSNFKDVSLIFGIIVLIYTVIYTLGLFYKHFLMRKEAKTGVILEISLEKDSEQNPFAIEQLWNAFHGLYLPWYKRLFKAQPFFSFEIKSENTYKTKERNITFNIWVPAEYKRFITQRLLAIYPNAEIKVLKRDYIPTDEMLIENGGFLTVETAELSLKNHSAFSIKTFKDFDVDPLASVTSAMTDLENRELAVVQIVCQPISYRWRKRAERVLAKFEAKGVQPSNRPDWTNYFSGFLTWIFFIVDEILNSIFFRNPQFKDKPNQKTSVDSERQKEMLEKTKRPPYSFQIRLLFATPQDRKEAQIRLRNMIASFNDFEGPYNGFKKEFVLNKRKTLERMRYRHLHVLNNDDIISTLELAGLAHLPNKNMKTPGLKKIQSRKKEAPINISEENAFAVAEFREGRQFIGLDENARMRHVYISGMTGVGKSTLLENMIINDIESGRGVVVIDPHGDLVDSIIQKVDATRDDIYLLNPADIDYPFGMNLLEITSSEPSRRELEKTLVIDAYITVMKRIFGESSIGANTDDIFRMSCSAILDHPEGGGLAEMLLMLTSPQYRNQVTPYIKNPIVKDYWEKIFPILSKDSRFQGQNLNAPLNKLRRFIANGIIANIVCQKNSTVDIANLINSGSVILARFSKGDIGFENSVLLGSMLMSRIQIAAMQRVSIPMEERVATYLYVDEFQNFVGDDSGAKTFAEILSEARKYKLALIIANQFVEQMRQASGNFLLEAIFNNCGTTITFRVGKLDAMFFEKIYWDPDLKDGFKANDLANLGMGEVVIRLITKSGIQSEPFLAKTFPPVKASPKANPELIIKRSRSSIGVPRKDVIKSIQDRMKFDDMTDIPG